MALQVDIYGCIDFGVPIILKCFKFFLTKTYFFVNYFEKSLKTGFIVEMILKNSTAQ